MIGVNIRRATEEDAAGWHAMLLQLDSETPFMMLEPGERETDPEKFRARVVSLLKSRNSVALLAEVDGKLAGFLTAQGGSFRRNRHSAHIVIGLLEQYTSKGIGGRLFEEIDHWAHANEITRLELSVMTHNDRGLRLYLRQGFQIEGTKRRSMIVNGAYVDEYYMAKLL